MDYPERRGLSEALGAGVIAAALVLAYWFLSVAYPYYYIWDMDLICAQDTLLINSGLLPDHVHHTGFGMYLILAWATRLGAALGLVSAMDLPQLIASLNPLAPLAELTDYLRRLSPLAGLGLVLLLWSALRNMLRPGALGSLIALAALGLMPGLMYQVAIVRTEAYSMFFWSGAVLALVLAARAGAWGRALGVGLAGVLLGLCLLTKMQAGLYVAAAPLFYVMSAALKPGGPKPSLRPGGGPLLALGLALAALAATILLVALALPLPVAPGVGAFMSHYQVAVSGRVILLMAGMALLAGALLWSLVRRRQAAWLDAAALLSWLAFGFVAGLGLHFALYADPATAWHYLLLDFKMAFLRVGFGFEGLWPRLQLLAFCWPTVFAQLASLALLAWAARRRLYPSLSFFALALGAAALLAYASILTTDRFILRDLLWAELLLGLLALAALLALARFQAFSLPWRWGALALAGLLALANLGGALHTTARLDANYNLYGWSTQRFFHGVYSHNQRRFYDIFRAAYPGQSEAQVADGPLGAQALNHARISRELAFVFPTLPLNLRSAGAALPGRPLWIARPKWHLASVSPQLCGALLVDASAAPPSSKGFLQPALVRDHSEELDKSAPAPPIASLAVLPRPGLEVYLFLPRDRWRRLDGTGLDRLPPDSAPRLTAQGPHGSLTLLGVKIFAYQEFPLADLGRDYVFLIKKPASRPSCRKD
ncbi:MAG: glycosyltransferase family 39 protein [Desulfarculaceae bacterium]|nr:glycosyltransferase family 39 protein [Desulfarculaceae bacterium]